MLGVKGNEAALGTVQEGKSLPSLIATFNLLISRINPFPLECLQGPEVQARGVGRLRANARCAGADVYESPLLNHLEFCKPEVQRERY